MFVASVVRSDGTAAATDSGGGGGGRGTEDTMVVHPVVARRGLDFLWYLCKTSSRVTYDMLTAGPVGGDGDGSGDVDGGVGASGARESGAAEPKGSGKGKGKGRRIATGKGKGKQTESTALPGAIYPWCS